MYEYLIKFWTNDNHLSGARIFAMSAGEAMQIAKDTYNAASIVDWQRIE